MRAGLNRRGFTLIELLVIVGIIGVMVSVCVVNVTAGQDAARIKSAARDVFATIRYARSRALASQQPVIITYSTAVENDIPCAKIEINSVSLAHAGASEPVERLYEPGGDCAPPVKLMPPGASDGGDDGSEGGSLYDFPPLPGEVVSGMRLKVLKEGEELESAAGGGTRRRRISVFSTTGALLNQFNESREKASAAAEEKEKDDGESAAETASAVKAQEDERVSIVWEVNGRTEPHRVWVYPNGAEPSQGLCIRIDQFGAAKILGEGEDE